MLVPYGTLRYLPFAALHDGERYLAERYATAILTPAAAAQAASPGVNVSFLSNNGDPYVSAPGNLPGDPSDAARAWQDLQDSGAKTVRSFATWSQLRGGTRAL